MALTHDGLLRHLVQTYDLDAEELAADTALFSTGLLDSFTLIELVVHLETEAGIKIRPVDFTLDNLDSVERIVRFIEKQAP